MLRYLFVVTALATAALAASCGSDSSSSTGENTGGSSSSSSGGVTAEEACAAYSKAACEKLNSCAPLFITVNYGDIAACEARIGLSCPQSINAEGSNTTPAAWKECADSAASVSCDDVFGRNIPEACRPEPGTFADGAACGNDAQCQSAHCNKDNDVCGVCAQPVAAGGACNDDNDCDYALSCAQGKCVARVDLGETCDKATPCKATLACSGGKCAEPAGAGAACDPVDQNCDTLAGLGCNKMSICQKVKFAAAGETCGNDGTDFIVCTGGSACKVAMAGGTGTCAAPAADGAACDKVNGPNCLAGATCVNGLCTLSDPAACK